MQPIKKFYYIRDIERKPIITVCLKKIDDMIGKGIAICSKNDNPQKEIGREWSEYYADLALDRKTDSEYTTKESALQTVRKALDAMTYELNTATGGYEDDGLEEVCLSLYNPLLSSREKKMLGIPLYELKKNKNS